MAWAQDEAKKKIPLFNDEGGVGEIVALNKVLEAGRILYATILEEINEAHVNKEYKTWALEDVERTCRYATWAQQHRASYEEAV